MGFLFALLSIFSEVFAKSIDKFNFRQNHIFSRELMFLVFSGMALLLLVFIVLTRQPLPQLGLFSISLLVLIATVSFLGNIFDYLSLKVDDLSLREPMVGFEPILAGLIGYFLFPGERKTTFLIAFIAAVFIVYWGTHQRKLRKLQKTGMFYLLLAMVCYGTLPSVYKFTLEFVEPSYIAFFRVVAVLLLSIIFFRLGRQVYSTKKVSYGLVSGAIYAVGAVASLYAIDSLGVVQTMLLMLLGPALMYLASYFILKEKVRRGEIVSSGLLASIVFVTVFI